MNHCFKIPPLTASTQTRKQRFQVYPLGKAFSKSSSFQSCFSVGGRTKWREKDLQTNIFLWTRP